MGGAVGGASSMMGGNTATAQSALPTWNASTNSWDAPAGSSSSFSGASQPNAASQADLTTMQNQLTQARSAMANGPSQQGLSLPDWITSLTGGNAMTGSGTPSGGLAAALGMNTGFIPAAWSDSSAAPPAASTPPVTPNLGLPSHLMPGSVTQPAYQASKVNSIGASAPAQLWDPSQMIPKPKAPTPAPVQRAAPAQQQEQPQYQLIPMNAAGGYNQPGIQQPMAIGDQWTGSGSVPMAIQRQGNAPQLMSGGIYTDNKGNYYTKDASGKMTDITNQSYGGQPGYIKNFFRGFGYS